MRLRYFDVVVKLTTEWGLSAINFTRVALDTVRHTGEQRTWSRYHLTAQGAYGHGSRHG